HLHNQLVFGPLARKPFACKSMHQNATMSTGVTTSLRRICLVFLLNRCVTINANPRRHRRLIPAVKPANQRGPCGAASSHGLFCWLARKADTGGPSRSPVAPATEQHRHDYAN